MELKLPREFTAASDSPRKVTAALNMDAAVAGEGICPSCNSPMEVVELEMLPVMSCIPCHIVLPIKDQ